MKKETLQLTPQKYKRSLEIIMRNCTPINLMTWKKWKNSDKNLITKKQKT
jgi:hypothetical protein